MTPKMQKFHNVTGKRENFRNHEMRYPQWNTRLYSHVRILIDETGRAIDTIVELSGYSFRNK